jgi:hypothetical protein
MWGRAPRPSKPSTEAATESAAQYCVNQGGVVEVREPYFNTNDTEQFSVRRKLEPQRTQGNTEKTHRATNT